MAIEVTVKMGCGDNPMSTVSDDMISTEEMAQIRGRQELLESVVISAKRSLALPHNPDIDLGDMPTMNIPELDIYGEHVIESYSIEITNEGIHDSVEVSQIIGTLLEETCAESPTPRYPITTAEGIANWNTQLTGPEEISFQAWRVTFGTQIGVPTFATDDIHFAAYDLRGFWKFESWEGMGPGDHFPDTYKKPNHISFSDESVYHFTTRFPLHGAHLYPTYVGGTWSYEGALEIFTVSQAMLDTTHTFQQILSEYAGLIAEGLVSIRRPR